MSLKKEFWVYPLLHLAGWAKGMVGRRSIEETSPSTNQTFLTSLPKDGVTLHPF